MTPDIRMIYQLCHKEIFEISSRTESDLKAWMANGNFLLKFPLVLGPGSSSNQFTLQVNQWDSLYSSLANDCNRFAQAAIESMWLVRKDKILPKSAGWGVVQMYYSSFYAVHAILRLFGWSCTQFGRDHVKKVHEIAVATELDGGAVLIEKGFYLSKIDNSNSCVEFTKLKDSHADTWSSFNDLLKWLIDNIPEKTTGVGTHKSDAMTLISDIKNMLSKAGAARGNWPSIIRNKIHYQHSHGAWFPYKGAIHNQAAVMKNTQWLNSPSSFNSSTENDDICSIYNVSNKILSIMFHLMRFGFDRAGKESYPLANGVFRLVNQIKAV